MINRMPYTAFQLIATNRLGNSDDQPLWMISMIGIWSHSTVEKTLFESSSLDQIVIFLISVFSRKKPLPDLTKIING